MPSKRCTKCGTTKSLEEFMADKRCPDGHNNTCKQCFNEYRKQRRKENEQYAKAYKDSNNKHYHDKVKTDETKMTKRRKYGRKYCKGNRLKRINDRFKLRAAGTLKASDLRIIDAMFKVCAYCGGPLGKYHLDHIVPVKYAGKTRLGNILKACSACNLSKGARQMDEWYMQQTFFDVNRYAIIKAYQLTYVD